MQHPYTTSQIESWDDLHSTIQSATRFVYRGQNDASWDLTSSFVRECRRLSMAPEYWLNTEYLMLRDFKRRAHLFEANLPEKSDTIGWLAFMQHYGSPTRLLDFTYSLYVACFFALVTAKADAAVWAIDDSWLRSNVEPSSISGLREDELEAQYVSANIFVSKSYRENRGGGGGYLKIPLGIYMLEPERQTERLGIQQGLFLMQKNVHTDFLENLLANNPFPDATRDALPIADYVHKLVLGEKIRMQGLAVLRSMNITTATLFPGIEGYAKAIMHHVIGS
ncbi:MAG TPA: FRG domain-containing protein [Candidatus Didemnitutus sp.]|nr:FRG domain-containing protein [Candidatus Didemnitutus sp.]